MASCDERKLRRIEQKMENSSLYIMLSFPNVWLFIFCQFRDLFENMFYVSGP